MKTGFAFVLACFWLSLATAEDYFFIKDKLNDHRFLIPIHQSNLAQVEALTYAAGTIGRHDTPVSGLTGDYTIVMIGTKDGATCAPSFKGYSVTNEFFSVGFPTLADCNPYYGVISSDIPVHDLFSSLLDDTHRVNRFLFPALPANDVFIARSNSVVFHI